MEPKDFRILLAERGIQELNRISNSLRIPKRKEFVANLGEIEAKLPVVKYSYMPAEEVAKLEELLKISEIAFKLRKDIQQNDFNGITTESPTLQGGDDEKAYKCVLFSVLWCRGGRTSRIASQHRACQVLVWIPLRLDSQTP